MDMLALVLPFPRAGRSPVAVLALASTSRGDLKAEEEPKRMGVKPITSNLQVQPCRNFDLSAKRAPREGFEVQGK
jgi:hypothetical protein